MLRHFIAAGAATMLFTAGSASATLIHNYEFTNGLTDSVAGGVDLLPSYTAGGSGSVAGGLYSFSAGGGLLLSSQLPGNVYTIELRVALAETSGYRKLISFENITSDLGLYNLNGSLNLFNVAASTTPADFSPDTFVDVRLSRDGAGVVTGYINGVQSLTYNDTSALFTAASALYFLRDDLAQNAEHSAGQLDYLRIYDTAAPSASAVPEPATWGMMIAGFGMIGGAARYRRRTARFAYA